MKDGPLLVDLRGMYGTCEHCGVIQPLSSVGVQMHGDGYVRKQPYCKQCRGMY